MVNLDSILDGYTGHGRDALLPVLWEVQTAYGYISLDVVQAISHALRIPATEIYGVVEFYSLFHTEPTGETVIHVCTNPSCGAAGADAVLAGVCERLGIQPGETSSDGRYTVLSAPCLGLCEHAPAALVSQRGVGEQGVAPARVDDLLAGVFPLYAPVIGGEPLVLLDGLQPDRAQSLAEYGDYAALRHALTGLSPDTVIETVEQSNLIGRGGAAFPTGRKWRFTRQSANTPRYVVCNADESEPGTFKDRVLLEGRPHLLLEGMALCGYAIGAAQGYLFIRGEYPEAARRMAGAITEAEAAGLLGENILGTDFSFQVEIRRGGGAYICGEETALFEAIEGKRGFPRIKPPFPTTHGLFGQPTVVNNVETLCTVPGIVRHGADWFRQWGTERSAGTKLVSVSGHVQRPGVYEIIPGMTLRHLLESLCGGITGNLQTVLMGGAAGTFLTPDHLDTRLTFEDLSAIGGTFGSGAIMVFNDTVDIRDVLQRLGHFFQHESCGKCFPCQLGTQRQMEILDRLDALLMGDAERLQDIGLTMTEASLCGLGQTAASAVLSAMRIWPEIFANREGVR
ncbi:MAG: NAD(P)H-dependent oxidoreductase subunit E [Anaerolineaceae bacterium]|nr:NAD(P)H-dependent oxidoreductase subunit E [Anaerolineaceae bacterium]